STVDAALARAGNAVQDDAVPGDREHAAGLLVNDPPYLVLHEEGSPAVGKHLTVEGKPAVRSAPVERGRYFLRRSHLDELARLQLECPIVLGHMISWTVERKRLEQP